MAILKKLRNLKAIDNTGFGNNSNNNSGRFFNRKTGSANVSKRGIGLLERYSWYHTFLGLSRAKFLAFIFIVYILVNLVFAIIYYAIGVEHLAGIERSHNLKEFSEVFFFSTQTFTTVGYGRISPTGFLTSAVATFEAFLGLLSFAIATGLFYGRFSRPKAFIKFSDNALIAPYKGGKALMLRLAPYKNNNLAELETKLTLAMRVEENGHMVNRFFTLDLEIAKVNALSLSWTLVHPIVDKSPLYEFAEADFKKTEMELLIFIKAFDEVFSNTVISRYSYTTDEIIWGAKYKIMFRPNENKSKTILDLSMLNEFEKVELPVETTTI
jgi:Inward rectifier potassium channel C-terminal domain/Ion channel